MSHHCLLDGRKFADLVAGQFNEAVLYAIYFRGVHPVAEKAHVHEPSCIVCSLSRAYIQHDNPVYSRLQLQAQLSQEDGPEDPDLRRFHHTLRAACVWLGRFLEHPDSQSARDLLADDSRYRSSSAHPAFTNRVVFLLCDTVVNSMEIRCRDCLRASSTHSSTCYLTLTSTSYWVILTLYNLGDLDSVKRRVWSLPDKDINEMGMGTLLLSLSMVARAGHITVLDYMLNEYLQFRYDSNLLCATINACRAGQLECAELLMSRSLKLNPACLPHDVLKEQRLLYHWLPNDQDVEGERMYRVIIVHLDPQRRQVGAGMYYWTNLREHCGKPFLNINDRIIATKLGYRAQELIEILVKRDSWVSESTRCSAVNRILTLFWATVEASFLLLYQYDDGSRVTRSCRKMVEESLKGKHADATKAVSALIENRIDLWLRPELQYGLETGLREQDLRAVYAAGYTDGLNIVVREKQNDPGTWCKRLSRRRLFLPQHCLHTVGQFALWFAIKKVAAGKRGIFAQPRG